MSKLVEFENVSLIYDKEAVLEDVTFSISKGEHTLLLGANGSGKSSIIKLIACEIYPSITAKKHKREIFGSYLWNINELRSHLGIVTNDLHNKFYFEAPKASGLEVVLSGFFGTLGLFNHQNITQKELEEAKDLMAKLSLTHLIQKEIRTMSTGELRRCIVARAMVRGAKMLLLDEPTVGLDIKAQKEFMLFVEEISKEATILLVTHHIEEIFEDIKQVLFIKDGKIYQSGTKEELITSQKLSHLFDTPLEVVKRGSRYSLH